MPFTFNPFTQKLDAVGSSGGGGGGDMLSSNNLSDVANKPTALINLGGTTVGINLFKLANPSAISFTRINADNTITALNASDFRTAIGASDFDGAYSSLTGAPVLGSNDGEVPVFESGGLGVALAGITSSGGLLPIGLSSIFSFSANTFGIANGGVTNAMLAGSIAYSKLSLTGAILNADLAGSISPSKITGTAAILGANNFTGAQAIASGSIGASAPGINLTQTWNGAGVQFEAVKVAVTQTAYGSAINSESRLQSWYGGAAGATIKAYVDYNGGFYSASGYAVYGSPSSGGGWSGIKYSGSGVALVSGGTPIASFEWFDGSASNMKLMLRSDARLGFSATTSVDYSAGDAFFMRDAAASIQLGADHATTATSQTIKAHDVTTGTGADLCLANGKGSVSGGSVKLAVSATNGAPSVIVTVKATGVVNIANLPTSASGLSAGDIWNNSGVLSVV